MLLPQIEVEEVEEPDLNAQIMAERLAYSLDRGRHYRRAGYYILRKIMDTGKALGAEIRVSGKVTSQRARTQIFRAGTMKKSGQPAQEAVDKGVAQCIQKSGVLGVLVKIMRADYKTGDGISVDEEALEKVQTKQKAKEVKRKKEDEGIEEEVIETEIDEEIEEIIDEVDEDEVKEISLESSKKK
ncbi:MAG: 30S ribosomal protein S3 [Promethearchaeota archaeon]|nr:MAG: 30S ribosomal protein S3 [Candidatus Lokiarchaeota archaeon]